MKKVIPRIKIILPPNCYENLTEILKNKKFFDGTATKKLKSKLSTKLRYKYITLTSNGFCSLYIALKYAAHIGKKNVYTVPIGTCYSILNAIKAAGLNVRFIDLKPNLFDFDTANISITKDDLYIVPNFFGKLSSTNAEFNSNFTIVDSAQSFFSSTKIPSKSKILIASFYPTKWINGINGGCICTNSYKAHQILEKMVCYDSQRRSDKLIRFNFKLNELNATLALASLRKGDAIAKKLTNIYKCLTKDIHQNNISKINYTKYEVPTRCVLFGSSHRIRNKIIKNLNGHNIGASKELLWLINPEERKNFLHCKKFVNLSFSIPFHPLLTNTEIRIVREKLL